SRSPLLALFALLGATGLAHAAPGTPPVDAPEAPAEVNPPPAAAPADVPPGKLVPDPDGVATFVAEFNDELAIRTDLLLEGVDAQTQVVFTVPEEWELVEDPVLVLDLAHSAALLGERSHLTVSLDGQPVGSVRLDAANATGQQLRLPIPRDLVQAYNHLTIRAVQHYGATCEDPFDPSLWTRVSNASKVEMKYRRKAIEPDLARFPYPLFDASGYGPAALTLVLPQNPSPGTIDAIGRLGLAIGRHADYRGVTLDEVVPTVREADTHAILVGLWNETPEIRGLLGEVGPRPSQGLVALVPNPKDPTRAVLVVTGADAEGLSRAVKAISSGRRHQVLTGPQARVDFVADGHPPASRRDPKPAPAAAEFSFAALGLQDQTVRGFYTPAVRVPITLEGDAALRPGDATALVRYGYAGGLDPRLSAMEIRLDGVAVKSVSLDEPTGETGATVRVPLPDALMTPSSVLEVAFTLFPKDYHACLYTSDQTLWATVYADSTLSLPRDGVADLPDLGRLRHGLWPFTLDPTDGGVVAALPDRPGAADLGAGFLMAAALGRWSHVEEPSFELRTANGLDFDGIVDKHVIVLSSGGAHGLYDSLARTQALALTRGPAREVREAGQRAMAVTVPDSDAVVAEVLHPKNPDRAVLVLSGAKSLSLTELVERVADPKGLADLDGDVALLDGSDRVRTLELAERRQVGTWPVGVALVLAIRSHWGLLGASLVAGAVVLALVKRAWMRAREG
ncbi:MAG: cellulose biosynthesis cyclic di-GMP-binding regulatory protein BcsB, partial [Myxococcota bacterium]